MVSALTPPSPCCARSLARNSVATLLAVTVGGCPKLEDARLDVNPGDMFPSLLRSEDVEALWSKDGEADRLSKPVELVRRRGLGEGLVVPGEYGGR